MQKNYIEKNPTHSSRAIAHQNNGNKSLVRNAVPVLQKQQVEEAEQNEQPVIQNHGQTPLSETNSFLRPLVNKQKRSEQKTDQPKNHPVVQRVLATVNAGGGTVAPRTQPQLRAWINANTSADVKALVSSANVTLTVTWNNGLADLGVTDMILNYTDSAGTAGNIGLFAPATATAAIAALSFPLQNYNIAVNVSVRANANAHGGAPVAALARSTWQATLAHELEIHTKLAKKVNDNLDSIARRPTDLVSKRRAMNSSIATRTGDAEHANLATGGGGMKTTHTNIVKNAARPQKVGILVDAAWDRVSHMNHVAGATKQKAAYRDIKSWVTATVLLIPNKTVAELARITAIKTALDTRIAAL